MYFYGFDRSDARRHQAQHAIDRALALSPDDLAVRSELGNYYYYGLRDYARAADYLEGVLQVAPHHVEILVQLAWVRRRQGQWIEATTLLNRALAIDPRNIAALKALAGNLRTFRHWEEALVLQRKVAALRSDDLDEQIELQYLVWSQTGSFDTYDAWRRTLPGDAVQRLPLVWYMDLGRAAALRDFATIVGLLEAPPARGAAVFHAKELLALVLLSKGDRVRALELAQSLQREALTELRRQPDNLRWLERSLVTHAMLGEPQAAWADYERWRALLIAQPDAFDVESFLGFRTSLYAMLGDRDLALQSMRETLKQRRVMVWGYWAHDLALVSLWDDPRFLQMANDPANNAPIPIANWDLPAMLKSK
jgi:Tfp pilus assembly protein PilF